MLLKLLPAIVIVVSSAIYSQHTTYSEEEENMVGYVNMGWLMHLSITLIKT